jgi:hypothetical protein
MCACVYVCACVCALADLIRFCGPSLDNLGPVSGPLNNAALAMTQGRRARDAPTRAAVPDAIYLRLDIGPVLEPDAPHLYRAFTSVTAAADNGQTAKPSVRKAISFERWYFGVVGWGGVQGLQRHFIKTSPDAIIQYSLLMPRQPPA